MNLLFTLFILGVDYYLLDLLPRTKEFSYLFGVGMLLAVFLDFAGVYYKTRLLYSFRFNQDRKIPFYFGFSFFPRLVLNGAVILLAFSAMGWLEKSEFLLLPAVVLAAMKEFWVRATLLNPQDSRPERTGSFKIWLGEIFLFLSMCMAYLGLWYEYLQDANKLIMTAKYPRNYGFIFLLMLLFIYAFQMPHLLEEYFRHKKRPQKVIAVISMLLPALAVVFIFFRMGYLT